MDRNFFGPPLPNSPALRPGGSREPSSSRVTRRPLAVQRFSSIRSGGRSASFLSNPRTTKVAVPTSLSTTTRCQYFPSVQPPPQPLFSGAGPVAVPSMQSPGPAPIPVGNPPPAAPDCAGTGPLPALCISVQGVSPDYLGSVFAVFDVDGSVKIRSRVISVTTWSSQGSNPAVARFQMVDALA